jgi:hypothetical protein
VGIRLGLFADAPPYRPNPPPDDMRPAEPSARAAA